MRLQGTSDRGPLIAIIALIVIVAVVAYLVLFTSVL